MKRIITFALFFALISAIFAERMVITYRAPESSKDTRFAYPLELITEAMDKTANEYGGYKLVPSPKMNFKRAQDADYIAKFENFIFETTVNEANEENLLSVKVPVAKGLYGYRIFLIDKNKKELFAKVNSLDDLKKLKLGQGKGWFDVEILNSHKFNVVQGANYEGLFSMLLHNRFDAFPRGVNEAFAERDARQDKMKDLDVEETLCLYYPLPRFFYTAQKNKLLAERLTKGLEIMIKDGSYDKIWQKHNSKYLKLANLKDRKIFRIPNNFVPETVPLKEAKYWYKP